MLFMTHDDFFHYLIFFKIFALYLGNYYYCVKKMYYLKSKVFLHYVCASCALLNLIKKFKFWVINISFNTASTQYVIY